MTGGAPTFRQRVEIMVAANASRAKAELSTLGRSLTVAGGHFARMGTMASMSFKAIALAAPVVALAATARFVQKSALLFVGFNDTLMRTKAILAGPGGVAPGFDELNDKIREVGRSTRFTATQAGQAANSLAVAGVTADEMISENALENLVKFAIAGGVDIQTATDIGIAGVKGFGLEMEELSRVSDVLVQTFTNANVTIVGLGEALKFAAPISAAAGIEIEETAAAIGALGNAGIRGTIAGTGLRMSMNKLLKPTFDARTAIESLGLDVFVLTDAGVTAKRALDGVRGEMTRTKMVTDSLSVSIKQLDNDMSDMSLEQRKNSLAIQQIRLRASRENRALTEAEEKQVNRLEMANSDLAIQQEELSIESTVLRRKQSELTTTYKELEKEGKDLNKTVELQTTGITSLADMLDQLNAAGATTAQVLEIFGVRGGTAMQALLAQTDAFHELAEANRNAEGRTMQFSEILRTSAHEQMLLFRSAIEDTMITLGGPFMFAMVDALNKMKGPLTDALNQQEEAVTAAGEAFAEGLVVAIQELITNMPLLIELFMLLMESLPNLIKLFKLLFFIMQPVIFVIDGITSMMSGLGEIGEGNFGQGLLNFFRGLFDLLIGIAGLMNPITRGIAAITGSSIGGEAGVAAQKIITGIGGGAAAGAAIGAAGGPIGMLGGAIIGGAIGIGAAFLADGGIVQKPTLAVVGEAGPEAVIPLSQARGMSPAGLPGGGNIGGGLTIGQLTVGANLEPSQVKRMIEHVLPGILRRELRGMGVSL